LNKIPNRHINNAAVPKWKSTKRRAIEGLGGITRIVKKIMSEAISTRKKRGISLIFIDW
jgi:hypothetical protein